MVDFNEAFGPGDVDGGLINVVIEIGKGSTLKIEWDRENKVMKLDRVEPAIFAKPTSYGFIPQTLDEDGDELDVLESRLRSFARARNAWTFTIDCDHPLSRAASATLWPSR